ncbi:MAG: sensor histidine kinase [Photobacterium frigidiphilum]|uniref:sensor histidine kinase n=1 Tax=Photobacterium frigidiphilum TaxID=264736 RepID=UPI0030029DA2
MSLYIMSHIISQNMSFRQRIWILLVSVIVLQIIMIGGVFHFSLSNTLNHQISTRAVIQAREIASDPQLIKAVMGRDTKDLKKQIDRLQRLSDADFIVAGDSNGLRLAHPNGAKVGYPMQGGDNARALKEGKHYFSTRKGSLGFAIRGKSPIFSPSGKIIGVISVGYLLDKVGDWLLIYSYPFFFALLLMLMISSIGAWFFTWHMKKQMYGMEPEEIALSHRVQKSVFEAVYEGIVAVDHNGRVLAVNKRALSILGISHFPEHLDGRIINKFATPAFFFMGVDENGKSDDVERKNDLITCNGETLIATRVRIWEGKIHAGWVISFRPRNDLNILTSQLTQIRIETDSMRVLSHEYANKLSTISGLIQIGAHEEALQTIRSETETHQKLIDFISQTFHSKVIAGLLLGKYSRAKELGLNLIFDPCCQLEKKPTNLSVDELAAIVGNLLDNAYEATIKNPNSNKTILILLTDASNELVIEVADNGTGISDNIADSLFTKGVSSKEQPGHGVGLYLVHNFVTRAGGTILVDEAEPQGTIFSLFIPNKSLADGNF